MFSSLIVTTTVTGFDYTVYFIPIILIILAIISIATRTGLFEVICGLFLIIFAGVITNDPYVIENTSYLSNGTLLVARTNFFMHPYMEIALAFFGLICILLAVSDFRNS